MISLRRALGVMPGDVASLVGGGGKTSLALALAREVLPFTRVVFTTTTKVYPVAGLAAVLTGSGPGWRDELLDRLAGGPVLLAREELPDGKLSGLAPEEIDELALWPGLRKDGPEESPLLLVEADGSAGRPFKAPAAHEPVIPRSSTLVLAVAGADSVGRRLDQAHVHRPEAVARILNLPAWPEAAHTLTAVDVATVLLHPEGTARGRPPESRLLPVLTRVDRAGALRKGEAIARSLVEGGARRAVLVSLKSLVGGPFTVAEMAAPRGPVAAVILAAGRSRRFGLPKLLYPVGGLPMLEWTVRAACRAGFARVLVVIPAESGACGRPDLTAEYRSRLAAYPVELVPNPDPEAGQSGSVRAAVVALESLGPGRPEAAMFIPGDQPFLTPAVLDALIEAWIKDRPGVLAPLAGGRRLSPSVFAAGLFPELQKLAGDRGGRSLIESRPERLRTLEFSDPTPFRDIDSPDDLP